jgi:AcrR family transcriptional regulator
MVKREKKTSDRAQTTRNHIINSYLKLMHHKSWNRITVKELCEEASVTRGTFYQYFDSISDLMETIEESTLKEIHSLFNAARQNFKPANVLYTSDFDRDFSSEKAPYTVAWFKYCDENEIKVTALFNIEKSDHDFIDKVKEIILSHLSYYASIEGLPDDAIGYQLLSNTADVYIFSIYTWFERKEADHITYQDIASIVDSIRTGGIYIARRNRLKDLSGK